MKPCLDSKLNDGITLDSSESSFLKRLYSCVYATHALKMKTLSSLAVKLCLVATGMRAREICPRCPSVPVQRDERDAQTKWRAAEREYLSPSLKCQARFFRFNNGYLPHQKKKINQQLRLCWGAFHNFLYPFHPLDIQYVLALHFSFWFLSLPLKPCFPFLAM